MSPPVGWYRWESTTLHLFLHVQPRAGRDEIVGVQGSRLKVRITAPPVDGEANAHLVKYLAKLFGVPRADVAVAAGAHSRDKHLTVARPQRLPESFPPAPEPPEL